MRITISALNDLDILAADIGNAYLNADTREKVYFIAGTKLEIVKVRKKC